MASGNIVEATRSFAYQLELTQDALRLVFMLVPAILGALCLAFYSAWVYGKQPSSEATQS